MPDDSPVLTIYVGYDYLAVQQLGTLLVELHGLFDELLYADAPALRELPTASAARLRIEAVATGGSVTVSVIQGVTQIAGSADPLMMGIASGMAALSAAGMLLLRLLHRAEDLRAKWLRDSRENDQQHLELARKRLELRSRELELSAGTDDTAQNRRSVLLDTLAVLAEQAPGRDPDQQEALAERLMPHLEAIARIAGEENIRTMRVITPEPGG